jgi:hypothetical protein
MDAGRALGSATRLKGLIHFPIDGLFDLAETSCIHEIGHQWMSFLKLAALRRGQPHWPLGDVAYGIMGWSPPGGQGMEFPFALVPQPNGDYLVQGAPAATEFNDLELYLMGLVPKEEVRPHFVFDNQDQASELRPGGTLRGPVTRFTIDDVIAAEGGPRLPAPAEAQKEFRLATIVLSKDRLLSAAEMAFFDHLAARGEATTELPFTSGRVQGTTKPFFLATGRRATLSTRVWTP